VKVGLMFTNTGPFAEPEMATTLAQTAEAAGVESLWTVEHVIVPADYQSEYPYAPGGKMPGPEDMVFPDPLLWLTYVAAVTQTIKLATGILILPQRHPFYVAKEVATLDRLSKGRVMLGVGIGWLEEEFDALGIDFASRAARTEESIAAIRNLWSEGMSSVDGDHFRWRNVHSNPKPVSQGGPPIVIGGHTKAAARRAARIGDGFFIGQADKLESLVAEVNAECGRIGRDPAEVEITTGGMPSLDKIKRQQDLGVSRFVTPPPGFDADGLRAGLDKLADEVISKL